MEDEKPDIRLLKVEVDAKLKQIADRMELTSIPAFLLMDYGQKLQYMLVSREIGGSSRASLRKGYDHIKSTQIGD